jgi:diacylglycerol kinase (ATP)
MRACVIFNPTAKGDKARHFRKHLDQFGGNIALKPTWAAGTGRLLATEAVVEGFDTIVAAGGDGTLNEVLNGITDALEGFNRARLAVLPLGTVNVFAKELGLPMNLHRAWEAIMVGREAKIDLPLAEFTMNGKAERRHFAQMAGAGLDARAIELVDWEHKKRVAQFAYVIAGFRAMKGPHPPIQFASVDTKTATGELVLIGNGRFYGGKLPIFHSASPTDGLLDVCVFRRVNWLTILRYAIGFVIGRALTPRDLEYFQTNRFTLSSAQPVPFELEGELAGHLPLVCSVQPKALRVIVP